MLDITPEITGLDVTYDIRERPSPVGRDQIEDRGNRRGETANDELAVEQNRGDLGALEQVAQIGVGAVELVDLAVEFGVDRMQLFIDRLQLLLGGLQLLVGGLQLLIDRNHFLVRGLELLQCAFIFLDRRLQTLPRVAQFVMQLRQAAGLGTRRKIEAARDR